jgi:serine phosphatase RsbU (regulator of sigma subunit)/Tfp pilus assembly protein PilF
MVDSLLNIWKDHSYHDTLRLQAIGDAAWKMHYNKPDSAHILAALELELAKKTGILRWEADAYNTIGSTYHTQGMFDEAIKAYEKGLVINRKRKIPRGIASVLNNIGRMHYAQARYEIAIDFYLQSLQIKEEMGDLKGTGLAYYNIGAVHLQLNEIKEARKYYQKALTIRLEVGLSYGIAGSYYGMGLVNNYEGNSDSALYYYHKALTYFKSRENQFDKANVFHNIGIVHDNNHDYDSARYYFKASLAISETLGHEETNIVNYLNLGLSYINSGTPNESIELCSKSLLLSTQNGMPHYASQSCECLAKGYFATNDFKQAYAYYERYVVTNDSLRNVEQSKEVARAEIRSEYKQQAVLDSLGHAHEQQFLQEKLDNEQTQRYALYAGLTVVLLFSFFIFNRFRVTRKQKRIIEDQKHLVDEKNTEILDSINYAKRIQAAILPPANVVEAAIPNGFILYKPKDIVAGDFYWLHTVSGDSNANSILYAAADCTGHGVPGALVSVVCSGALDRSVQEFGITEPGKVLDKTRELVVDTFEESEEEVKDGMDIALCEIKGKTLRYSGAHNPLWIIRNGEVMETKANKQPIGKVDNPASFTTHTIQLLEKDTIYTFSDGYVDQFGGERGKKFKAKAFKELLLSIQDKSMKEQQQIIDTAFEQWKGDLEQVDDVCVIGVRI